MNRTITIDLDDLVPEDPAVTLADDEKVNPLAEALIDKLDGHDFAYHVLVSLVAAVQTAIVSAWDEDPRMLQHFAEGLRQSAETIDFIAAPVVGQPC